MSTPDKRALWGHGERKMNLSQWGKFGVALGEHEKDVIQVEAAAEDMFNYL